LATSRMNLISAVHVAGTGGELRTLWVASEFCRLDRRHASRQSLRECFQALRSTSHPFCSHVRQL
jgi:hypothetical protein